MKHIANYTLDEFKEICSSIPYYIVEIVYAYYHRDKSYTIVQFAMSEHIHFALRFAPRVAVPSGVASNTPVKIVIGGITYDILDKYGETMTFAELPHDIFFSPRFVIVGGVGSSVSEETTSYYYIAWDIPYAQ